MDMNSGPVVPVPVRNQYVLWILIRSVNQNANEERGYLGYGVVLTLSWHW